MSKQKQKKQKEPLDPMLAELTKKGGLLENYEEEEEEEEEVKVAEAKPKKGAAKRKSEPTKKRERDVAKEASSSTSDKTVPKKLKLIDRSCLHVLAEVANDSDVLGKLPIARLVKDAMTKYAEERIADMTGSDQQKDDGTKAVVGKGSKQKDKEAAKPTVSDEDIAKERAKMACRISSEALDVIRTVVQLEMINMFWCANTMTTLIKQGSTVVNKPSLVISAQMNRLYNPNMSFNMSNINEVIRNVASETNELMPPEELKVFTDKLNGTIAQYNLTHAAKIKPANGNEWQLLHKKDNDDDDYAEKKPEAKSSKNKPSKAKATKKAKQQEPDTDSETDE